VVVTVPNSKQRKINKRQIEIKRWIKRIPPYSKEHFDIVYVGPFIAV